MRRYLITLALLMLNILPMLAYGRHGRDYSVNGGHGSSLTILFVFVLIGFCIYAWISSMFNRNNKK